MKHNKKKEKIHIRNARMTGNDAREPRSDLTTVLAREAKGCSKATSELISLFHSPYNSKISVIPNTDVTYELVGIGSLKNGVLPYKYSSGETWAFKVHYEFTVDQRTLGGAQYILIPSHGCLGYNDANHIMYTGAAAAPSSVPTMSVISKANIQQLTPRTLPPAAPANGKSEYMSMCLGTTVHLSANNLTVTQKSGTISILSEGAGYYPDNLANINMRPRTQIINGNIFSDDGYRIFSPGNGWWDNSNTSFTTYDNSRVISCPYVLMAFDSVGVNAPATFTLTIESCGVITGSIVPSKQRFNLSSETFYCAYSCFRKAYLEGSLVEKGGVRVRQAEEHAERHEMKNLPGTIYKLAMGAGKHVLNYLKSGGYKDVLEAIL